MANNRDDILDFAKGLLICLVVYAHLPMEGKWHDSLHSLAGFLYTFHIYAFVLITGFLFSRKLNGGRKEILKVAVRMFKPYFAVGVLNVLFYCIAGKLGIKTTGSCAMQDGCSAVLDVLRGNGGGALWYLYTFGTLQILMLLCNMVPLQQSENGKVVFSSAFSCAIAYLLKSAGLALNFTCLSFFYIGIFIGTLFDRMPRHLLCLCAAPLVYLIPCESFMHSPLHAVWVLCVLFGMLGAGEKLKYSWFVKCFSFLGRHTLTILLFHPFITTASRLFSGKLLMMENTGVLLSLVILSVDVSCCVLFELALRKIKLQKLLF